MKSDIDQFVEPTTCVTKFCQEKTYSRSKAISFGSLLVMTVYVALTTSWSLAEYDSASKVRIKAPELR